MRNLLSLSDIWHLDFLFLCTFVLVSEKSTDGTFVPVELSFPGTFVPLERKVQELFAPWNFRSHTLKNWGKALQQSSVGLFSQWCRPKPNQPSLAEAFCRIVALLVVARPTCLCVSVFVWLPSFSLCYVVIVHAVVVNLHVSATLTAVLPVKNFIHARGLLGLDAKLRSIISYQYLTTLRQHAPRCRQISC